MWHGFSFKILRFNMASSSSYIRGIVQFLSPYKIDLPLDPAYEAPWPPEEQFTVSAVNDTIDENEGTRSMTLKIDHPGIMWTGEFFSQIE
jgi:hypothetical protein